MTRKRLAWVRGGAAVLLGLFPTWLAAPGVPAASPAAPGTTLWNLDRNVDDEDKVADVVMSSSQPSVFVVGTALDSDLPTYPGSQIMVSQVDATTGTAGWVTRSEIVNGKGESLEIPVRGLSDGTRVFVVGTAVNSAREIFIQSYDGVYGQITGSRSVPINAWLNEPADAVIRGDGMFITGVVGTPNQGGDPYRNLLTMRVNTWGLDVDWVRSFSSPSSNETNEVGTAITVSPDGRRVFVTGSTTSGPYSKGSMVTIAYDATTGERLWLRTLGTNAGRVSGEDIAAAEGSVFVTGHVGGHFATVAYDQTDGATRWLRLHDGGRESAQQLALAAGRVIVAGRSHRTVTAVAYDMRSGGRVWARRLPGKWPLELAVQPGTDNVILRDDPGRSWTAPQIAVLDGTDGAVLWSQPEQVPAGDPWATGMTTSANGSTLFFGTSPNIAPPTNASDLHLAAIALPQG